MLVSDRSRRLMRHPKTVSTATTIKHQTGIPHPDAASSRTLLRDDHHKT